MSVSKRLASIETAIAGQSQTSRCAVCRDWPGIRMTTVTAGGLTISEDRPARCPGCGFESDSRGTVRSITVVIPSDITA